MFQIKDFGSIAASLINVIRATSSKITDFNRGSVVRTMLEATAAELEELYLQMFVGLREAIPVSVYQTFGFEALPAVAASGAIRFSTGGSLATAEIQIPAGTVVRVPGSSLSYATVETASILIGNSYVDVLAAASAPGAAGNTAASTITELAASISGVSTVTNPAPLVNGRDEETDEERRVRFGAYIAALARGTKSAIEYGAKDARLTDTTGTVIEYVASALVVEPWLTDNTQPISLVRVYVHNGAGATSGALVTRAQQVIDGYIDAGGAAVPGWKAAGVQCIVQAASDVAVNVTGELVLETGADGPSVTANCVDAIKSHLQRLGVGEDVRLSELVAIIRRDVAGVYNVSLTAPTADTAIAQSAKAVPGTITLTVA